MAATAGSLVLGTNDSAVLNRINGGTENSNEYCELVLTYSKLDRGPLCIQEDDS